MGTPDINRWLHVDPPLEKPDAPEWTVEKFWRHIENESLRMAQEVGRALSGATSTQERKRAQRKANRRRFKPGYPRLHPFQSIEDVRHYLSHPELTCLICGNPFLSLGGHIGAIHRVSEGEYKTAYGIPSTYGLVCPDTHEKHSDTLKDRLSIPGEKQKLLKGRTPEEQAQLARNQLTQEKLSGSLYKKKIAIANFGEFYRERFSDGAMEHVLRLMSEKDLLLREAIALGLPGMPRSHRSVYGWIRSDPQRQERYRHIVESLSFAVQARGQCLGERFFQEVKRLRHAGKTIHAIARELGVQAMTVQSRLDRLKREGDPGGQVIGKPPKTHCQRGHPYLEGKRRCQACDTETKRRQRIESKQHE